MKECHGNDSKTIAEAPQEHARIKVIPTLGRRLPLKCSDSSTQQYHFAKLYEDSTWNLNSLELLGWMRKWHRYDMCPKSNFTCPCTRPPLPPPLPSTGFNAVLSHSRTGKPLEMTLSGTPAYTKTLLVSSSTLNIIVARSCRGKQHAKKCFANETHLG